MSNQWKSYITRSFWLSDYDLGSTGHILDMSNGIVTEVLYAPREGKTEIYFREDQWIAYLQQLGEQVLAPEWSLEEHRSAFTVARKRLEQRVTSLEKASTKADLNTLAETYEALYAAYRKYALYIWFPWGITFFLEGWVAQKLQVLYPDDWEEKIELIGRTPKRIQMDSMIDDVCRWYLRSGGESELQQIAHQYGHLGGYSVTDSPWTAQEILKRSQPLRDCAQRLKEATKTKKEVAEAYSLLQNQLVADDPVLAKAVDVIHEYTWLRTERIDVFKWSLIHSQPFFHQVEKLMGWEQGWAAHLTVTEMRALLGNGQAPPKGEMKERSKGEYCVLTTQKGTTVYSEAKEKEAFLKEQLQDNATGQETLKGQIACKGKATGSVRLIFHTEEVFDFQEGEILVANMTHPDYMPAIHKAAALVTDEGGIVSHAAVISRELNVPCIMGVGGATKVLKNGDRVTVDAEKGIITRHV